MKLRAMTEENLKALAIKAEAKEELTEEEINMVSDEMLALLATWAQKRNPGYWSALAREREMEEKESRIHALEILEKKLKELSLELKKIELNDKHRRDRIIELEDLVFRLENPPKKWYQFWK